MDTERTAAPWIRAHTGWFQCRMNEHYYRALLQELRWWDRGLRWSAIFLSSGGVVGALALAESKPAAVTIALVSSLISAITLVAGISEKMQAAAALLPQYTALGAVFRELYYQADDAKERAVIDAWRELDRIQVTESEKLPSYSKKGLDAADAKTRQEGLGTLAPA